MKKHLLLYFFILALTEINIFSQEKFYFDKNNSEVNVLTLENSLTVFVKNDSNLPLIKTEFVCRAGYSNQNTGNTGFFSLYSNLFIKTASTLSDNPFDFIEVKSLCKSDSTSYSADVPEEYLDNYLKAISLCLTDPYFSDEELSKTLKEYKSQINEYSSSLSGFINTAIDSKVFESQPWKQESGIYPSFFMGYTEGEVRTILKNIQKEFYIPENCAIFITGNISKEKAYELCKKNFSSWKKSSFKKEKVKEEKLPLSENKKFAIVSSDFSKELTQIVVQYTSLDEAECDILNEAFNLNPSPLKTNLLSEEKLSIRSASYISSAAAKKSSSSRLIIQSLLEKSEENNPALQAELFCTKIKEASIMERSTFIKAQDAVNAKYLNTAKDSVKAMELLADFWSLDKNSTSENFSKNFYSYIHSSYTKTEKDITKKVLSESPYVFLIINDSLWNDFEKDFIKSGFEKIEDSSSFWYKNELLKAKAREEKKKALSPLEKTLEAITGTSDFLTEDLFYFKNYSDIKTFNLTNGISCAVKENKDTSRAVLSIGIYGGEAACEKNQLQIRNILINALSININQSLKEKKNNAFIKSSFEVSAWTEENISFIQIEFMAEDIKEVLQSSLSSLVWAEIQPLTADHLVSEQNYQWSLKKQNLAFQLKTSFLNQIYKNTEYEKIYDLKSEILKNTDYISLSENYTKLLDASLYSIVIAGNVDSKTCENLLEESFGILKEQTLIEKKERPSFNINKKEYIFQLSHNYTSDKTKKDAPKDVPVLIPTKKFSDPALFIFKGPENYTEEEIFNSLIIELSLRMSKKLKSESFCDLLTSDFKASVITIEKINKSSEAIKALKDSLKEIKENLNSTEKSDEYCLKLKAQWSVKALSKCQSLKGTSELLHKSLLSKNPYKYLEGYSLIQKALKEDFISVFEKYFSEEKAVKVFSKDTKK